MSSPQQDHVSYEEAVRRMGRLHADASDILDREPHLIAIEKIIRRRNFSHPDWDHRLFSTPLYVTPRPGATRCFAITSRLDRVLPNGDRLRAEDIRVAIHAFPHRILVSDVHVIASDYDLMEDFYRQEEALGLGPVDDGHGGFMSIILLVDLLFPELVLSIVNHNLLNPNVRRPVVPVSW